MQLITLADRYFAETINDECFVLGLDSTGVYLLTESPDVNKTLREAQELIQDLDLRNSEVILCYVGEGNPGYRYATTQERFDVWLREVVGSRTRIFSRADLQEIENCYKEELEDDLSLINALREYDISEGAIQMLVKHPPNSVREIEELGVVREVAVAIYDVFDRKLYTTDGHGVAGVPAGITITLQSYRKKKTIWASVYLAIAAVSILVLKTFYMAIPISLIGYFINRKAGGKDSPFLTRFIISANITLFWLSLIAMIIQVFPVLLKS